MLYNNSKQKTPFSNLKEYILAANKRKPIVLTVCRFLLDYDILKPNKDY